MRDPNQTTLSESTIDELLEEFSKRSPCLVVAYILQNNEASGTTIIRHHGNRMTCLGMSIVVQSTMMKTILDASGPTKGPYGSSDEPG